MTAKITASDFKFKITGYGRYDVTYTSPVTGKDYSCSTTDMSLIDGTKGSDSPKIKDLLILKRRCKEGQRVSNEMKEGYAVYYN